ncbi:hypothetical protein ABBQ38_003338 [Trebouxia sp. C0009 RCD-2024]
MQALQARACNGSPFYAARPVTRHTQRLPVRRSRRVCTAVVGTSLTFNIAETSVTFPFQKEQAQQLSNAITTLIQTFAAKQKAERPRRWDLMEYKYKEDEGNGAEGVEYLEVVCNPNAYATAFDAKVLITIRSSQGLKVTTEGRLSNLKGDVDTFLEKS